MRVLVTGASGQLGHDVMLELKKRGIEGVGCDRSAADNGEYETIAMDITDRDRVSEVISGGFDAVIHCAAWTNVDAAEDEANKPAVYKVNVEGTENIALACKENDVKMMYISTDYVFNGEGDTAWDPDCKEFAPVNYYGETKLGGEKAVADNLEKFFVVRISWVFGPNGKNFINTMLSLSETHDELRVVNDQIGSPTYTIDLARLLVDMIVTDKYGFYNATNEGDYISWADFAKEIFKQAGKDTKVTPVTTEEYGLSKAKRPFNSRMSKEKLSENGFDRLPTWQDALARYLALTQN
jgi:dTDP-4-dehydrorhamnose reductase